VQAATAAAEAWLALIDEQKYAESWSAASTLFQSAISQENWAAAAGAARGPLGNVVSRQFQGAEYKTSAPGAPDGHYVVIQFSTSFANKAQAVETITPMQESDGAWKVAGYFVK
jgi:hypothetical protein